LLGGMSYEKKILEAVTKKGGAPLWVQGKGKIGGSEIKEDPRGGTEKKKKKGEESPEGILKEEKEKGVWIYNGKQRAPAETGGQGAN